MTLRLLLGIVFLTLPAYAASAQAGSGAGGQVMVDDFQGDAVGKAPSRWRFFSSKNRTFEPLRDYMNDKERFYVVEEGGNRFLRGYTQGEAQRISVDARALGWDLGDQPVLSWRWRARKLPVGASEDGKNDTGGAVLVTFDKTDWLGRPYSIKYTYSSSLPAGTTVSFGNLKVIVAASGTDGFGTWKSVRRNVDDDYRRAFGGTPPPPVSITLWSDSDDTKSTAEVDFDDIAVGR